MSRAVWVLSELGHTTDLCSIRKKISFNQKKNYEFTKMALGKRLDECIRISHEVHLGNTARYQQESERRLAIGGVDMVTALAAQAATAPAVPRPATFEASESWAKGKSGCFVSKEALIEVSRYHEALLTMTIKEKRKPTNCMILKRLVKFAFNAGRAMLTDAEMKHFFTSESSLSKFAKNARNMKGRWLSYANGQQRVALAVLLIRREWTFQTPKWHGAGQWAWPLGLLSR
jgi:hypothetical protein